MCGISGILHHRAPHAEQAVAAMLRAMAHRGPDGSGTLTFAGGAAGMVRLALVDLSARGQQPMWSPNHDVAILWNGEMYNFREERAGLGEYPFHSHTDTEVALALYLTHGDEFLARLRGMFATAIFDWRGRSKDDAPRVLLARDRFGIKPLYLAERGETLAFASEVRALVASGVVDGEICPEGLDDYLRYGFVVQPRTILRGVRMMEPGTATVIEPGCASRSWRYAELPAAEQRPIAAADAARELREVLDESIALQAFADAPVGAFLSGGVDSTAIVGLMRPHIRALHTYTLAFPDCPDADESVDAALTAKVYDAEHTTVAVTRDDAAGTIAQFAGDLDQPSIDGFNTWLVSRAAARDVKGVLSGLGGDEWFGGYGAASRMAAIGCPSGLGWRLGGQVAHLVRQLIGGETAGSRLDVLASKRSVLTTWLAAHRVFSPREVAVVTERGVADGERVRFEALLDGVRSDWRSESAIGLASLLDARVYMGSQLLRDSDATSMAHSLELRVPLIDRRVAAYARSVPDRLKIRCPSARSGGNGLGGKRVLLDAVRDLLPAHIVGKKKRGFALPYAAWLGSSMRDIALDASASLATHLSSLVDGRRAARVVEHELSQPGGQAYPKAWSLMMLGLWAESLAAVRGQATRWAA